MGRVMPLGKRCSHDATHRVNALLQGIRSLLSQLIPQPFDGLIKASFINANIVLIGYASRGVPQEVPGILAYGPLSSSVGQVLRKSFNGLGFLMPNFRVNRQ